MWVDGSLPIIYIWSLEWFSTPRDFSTEILEQRDDGGENVGEKGEPSIGSWDVISFILERTTRTIGSLWNSNDESAFVEALWSSFPFRARACPCIEVYISLNLRRWGYLAYRTYFERFNPKKRMPHLVHSFQSLNKVTKVTTTSSLEFLSWQFCSLDVSKEALAISGQDLSLWIGYVHVRKVKGTTYQIKWFQNHPFDPMLETPTNW